MYQISEKQQENSTKKKLLLAGLVGVLPFLAIAIIGYFDWSRITTLDYQIGSFFYGLRAPMRTSVITIVTHIGDSITLVAITGIVSLLLFILKKWRTALWYGFMVAFGPGALNFLIKEFYARVRPIHIEHLVEQSGYSFPSGHSMGSMVVLGGIAFLLFRVLHSKQIKWLVGILISILILTIGLTRIYLGVHYPSDIVAGFSLGFFWLCLSVAVYGLKSTRIDFQEQKSPYTFKSYL